MKSFRRASAVALLAVLMGCAAKNPPTETRRPNVLILSADSLRPDRLSPFNPDATASTPHLVRLAKRGVVFHNAWATSPWTAPSVVSIFTGLYPPSHGVVHRDDTTPAALPTLPKLLENQGYRLGNFSFFSGVSYFRNLGFPEPDPGLSHAHPAASFNRWVEPDQPFLAWIHLIEPHLPYGAAGYQATTVAVPGSTGLERSQLQCEVPVGTVSFDPGDRKLILALYDQDLEIMDRAIGKIMRVLKQKGVLDETIVVFVADHGEELLEHGWVGHASTAIEAKLIPEILRIPLIVAGPSVPAGLHTDVMAQQVDILPTLCTLLEMATPDLVDGLPLPFKLEEDHSSRSFAFFDSSAGGNLTPLDRRSERLQGAADGNCLLARRQTSSETVTTVIPLGAGECREADERALHDQLMTWQELQTGQRLGILSRSDREQAPDLALADSFSERISIVWPPTESTISWQDSAGQIVLEWQGGDAEHWIEYAVGKGLTRVTGVFRADSNPMVFGPFPQGFWNDLSRHNPFRFRVLAPAAEDRSRWVEFGIEGKP